MPKTELSLREYLSNQHHNPEMQQEIYLLFMTVELCRQWFDEVYPDDVFTGESGDPGAIRISTLRSLCRKVSR